MARPDHTSNTQGTHSTVSAVITTTPIRLRDRPARAMSRLETLCLMSDADVPLIAVRRQIIEAINLVVQIQRIGGKRMVTEIGEVLQTDFDGGQYAMKTLFRRDGSGENAKLIRVSD